MAVASLEDRHSLATKTASKSRIVRTPTRPTSTQPMPPTQPMPSARLTPSTQPTPSDDANQPIFVLIGPKRVTLLGSSHNSWGIHLRVIAGDVNDPIPHEKLTIRHLVKTKTIKTTTMSSRSTARTRGEPPPSAPAQRPNAGRPSMAPAQRPNAGPRPPSKTTMDSVDTNGESGSDDSNNNRHRYRQDYH